MSRRSTTDRSDFNDNASNASSNASRRPTINFQEIMEDLPHHERETGERLRRHLQFFFMNPMEKWKVRHQLPYKLVLQVLKIVFVTMQLILFAEMRMSHVDFLEDTTTVMRHRFLKEWNDDRDALQYPPAEGRYSVYDDQGLSEHLSFLINSYYSIRNDSFASFSYDVVSHPSGNLGAQISFESIPPIEVLIDRISNVTVNNNTYNFDIREVKDTKRLNLTETEVFQIGQSDDAVRDILATRGITFLPEDALKISTVQFKFRLRTIHYSPTAGDQKPECYKISVSIKFDNSRHTGQVHVTLSTVVSYVNVCNGRIIKGVGWSFDTLLIGGTDIFVLILCILSLILCCRALIKAHLLQIKTSDYFENVLKNKITVTDQLDFLNLWYVMIVVNDALIIIGTVAKISIEFQFNKNTFTTRNDFDNSLFTLTSIFLGMGALLVYVGVLRYFGFFSQYNILMLTLKRSAPNIMRFMTCAIVLYAGFLIAGWVIIGPYSMKFRTLAESSEALFSLLNGDDMFATFYTINDSNTVIKVFGTVYIYLFVSLFIYVVLSLFIAIIMDAYEVVKDRYSDGLRAIEKRGCLRDFVESNPPPSELGSPTTRSAYAPSNLLNLGRCVPVEVTRIFLCSGFLHTFSFFLHLCTPNKLGC
ncbi:Polycystin cation channel PKD1/PKD2 domain-containing protein [Caenorhabditis elegans]|uniref:Polycystin cation channel PKD1/PKD2 domain-containing protein n=1 Tax=Caenorhabditis elegans TaxID=6239 RepID=Q8WSP3_CAEEL|nr:Polycystin cation channel PKD1/PKD2 domain-containing protein [Caenorhabditis elegans]CCD63608.1 Polycystin cation channel PKD1/PKD2 domain-containing protein [Caenorhabditis elegans]|eukprot:NP_498664.3 Uncharacterized protein CELE_R13A5.1 [Caenorhabditis elegans]